jgi:hypothetical protein
MRKERKLTGCPLIFDSYYRIAFVLQEEDLLVPARTGRFPRHSLPATR